MIKYVLVLVVVILSMPMVNAYKDVGLYIEFYSDDKINEIANDKIIINNNLVFPKEIIIASKSLDEFYTYENEIKGKIHKDIIVNYWPILNKEEGYWISFDANTKALDRIFSEIKERKNKNKLYVSIDFENPIQKVENINKEKNIELIKDFLANEGEYNLSISLIENAPTTLSFKKNIRNKINIKDWNIQQVKMYYSSLRKRYTPIFKDEITKLLLNKEIQRGLKQDKNYIIALGCLDTGIMGNELLLSEKELKEDLNLIKKYNLKKVLLFGYKNNYKEVLREFIFS